MPSLIVYLLSSSIIATSVVALALTYYFYKYHEYNKDRKEPLSILLGDNQLHFMLSDDNFLDVPLKKDQNISEVITNTVKNEMATIKQIVDRIHLVNIKDEQLQNQLNSMIAR
ncbi:hypothetical protein [Aliarcobacter cryaerophilus]|uniref:hypothetical protein n=1 Tax=Aliarcobacter cryaerophilus TaxID=28198 RepID=UPI003DA3F218